MKGEFVLLSLRVGGTRLWKTSLLKTSWHTVQGIKSLTRSFRQSAFYNAWKRKLIMLLYYPWVHFLFFREAMRVEMLIFSLFTYLGQWTCLLQLIRQGLRTPRLQPLPASFLSDCNILSESLIEMGGAGREDGRKKQEVASHINV